MSTSAFGRHSLHWESALDTDVLSDHKIATVKHKVQLNLSKESSGVATCTVTNWTLRNFSLLQNCSLGFLSRGMLRGVGWYLITDVSGQPIDPIFKSQIVLDCMTLDDLLLKIWHMVFLHVGKQPTPRNKPQDRTP